jgi:LysM repeat protein
MATLPFEIGKTRKLAKMTFIRLDIIDRLKIAKSLNTLLRNSNLSFEPSDYMNFAGEISAPVFSVMYNPESFSRTYTDTLIPLPALDDKTPPPLKSTGQNNQQYSFKLFFDATGASPSAGILGPNITSVIANAASGVDLLINQFKQTVFTIDQKTHTGARVLVIWGTNRFIGRVASFTVNYKLFDRSGRPIRADVDIKIVEDDPLTAQSLIQKLQSPDVTKTYTVKAGDTLTLLAKKMYEDESLYLEIARINGLTNYRKLTPGQVLVFPPINKEEL